MLDAKRCLLLHGALLLAVIPAANAQSFDVVVDLPYATEHSEQLFDWYPAPGATSPSPCVVYMHGGGPGGLGSKSDVVIEDADMLSLLLDNGMTVMAIDYRPFPEFIYPTQIQDGAAALQHFRANAAAYAIDPDRLMGWGISGGAIISGLLAYGPDHADPSGTPTEQQSSRPTAFMNITGLTNWTLMDGGYPALLFGEAVLALVDPMALDDASMSWHVGHTPRPVTPPVASFYGNNENPPPLTDPHDVTHMLDLHAELAAFPAAAAQSIQLQRPEGPSDELDNHWQLTLWAMERFGLEHQLDLGLGLAGSGGVTPSLAATGDYTPGGAFTLTMQASVSQPSLLWMLAGDEVIDAPFLGGTLVPAPQTVRVLPTDADGHLVASGFVPPTLAPGDRYYVQFWHADPGAPFGFAASNGVLVLIE